MIGIRDRNIKYAAQDAWAFTLDLVICLVKPRSRRIIFFMLHRSFSDLSWLRFFINAAQAASLIKKFQNALCIHFLQRHIARPVLGKPDAVAKPSAI